MHTGLFETPKTLASKYRAGMHDDIHDELIDHKFWTVELHHHAMKVEGMLKRKAASWRLSFELARSKPTATYPTLSSPH